MSAAPTRKRAAKKPAQKTADKPRRLTDVVQVKASGKSGGSHVAQVRLTHDEVAALEIVKGWLNTDSTSDALREGLYLLAREAAEGRTAEEIRAFYEDGKAPLPEGVVPADDAELAAADDVEW